MALKFKKGDTLSEIASRHGIKIPQLMAANPNIKNANSIKAGASYNLPPELSKNNKGYTGRNETNPYKGVDVKALADDQASKKKKRLADSILKTLKKKKTNNGGDSVAEGAMPAKNKSNVSQGSTIATGKTGYPKVSQGSTIATGKTGYPKVSQGSTTATGKTGYPDVSQGSTSPANKKRGLFDKFSDFVKGEGKKISSDFGKAVKETERNFSDKRYFVNGVDSRKEKIKSKSNITQKKKK